MIKIIPLTICLTSLCFTCYQILLNNSLNNKLKLHLANLKRLKDYNYIHKDFGKAIKQNVPYCSISYRFAFVIFINDNSFVISDSNSFGQLYRGTYALENGILKLHSNMGDKLLRVNEITNALYPISFQNSLPPEGRVELSPQNCNPPFIYNFKLFL